MSNQRNLAIPDEEFAALSMKQCRSLLDEAGLKKSPYNVVLYELHDLLDWEATVRIGIKDFFTGWTLVISDKTLAEDRCGCSVNTLRKAISALIDAGIIKRQKVGKCYRYRIMRYKPMIDHLKQNPPKTKKIEYVDASDGTERTETKHTTRQNKKANSADNSQNYANFEDKQDSSRFIPDLAPPPEPDPVPDKNVEEAENDSQKEKTPDLTAHAYHLADKFAGDEIEFTPDDLRHKRAHQFRDHLAKMLRSPSLAEECPDDADRLDKCTQVLALWIEIVRDRDRPAETVGFMGTEPGMKALSQARKQVFESARDFQEYLMSPEVIEEYERRFGENWREKREQLIRKGGHL